MRPGQRWSGKLGWYRDQFAPGTQGRGFFVGRVDRSGDKAVLSNMANNSTGDYPAVGKQDDRPTYYITTPIYYPSGKLHIGHAYTTVAADFVARYRRQSGYDTWFLTGTDEHGLKIARAAAKEGLTPQAFVDRAYADISALWRLLEISNDDFIRTTEPRHKLVVQRLFEQLHRQGDIYKGVYEGWYCAPCETFLLERQLVDGNCPDCGRACELVREEAYFFNMARYQERWLTYVEEHPDFIQPAARRNEMINFVKQGLNDLCVSRTSFTWGIPVTFDPQHVVYVWLDALTNYISALGYGEPGSKYDRYWPADVHLMAKEIVRFHTIIWPIILMAAGIPLPKQIFGHGWLVLEGEKISKSRGNVIDPVILVERYGLDAVRYFLLRELPFGADGNYSEEALIRRTNVELANDLGNLLQRTLAMVERFAGGRVPTPTQEGVARRPLPVAAERAWAAYAEHMDRLELSNALGAVLELVGRANKYIEEQLPWDLAKEDGKQQQLATVLYDLLETLRVAAILLYPALRRAPEGILRQIGLDPATVNFALPGAAAWGGLPPGGLIHRAESLFPRIETEETVPLVTASVPAASASAASTEAAPGAAPVPSPDKELISYDDFAKLDLRVAEVLAAEPVKKADRLLKLQVRIGDQERQIVAGIAQHYRAADLVGKHIVVVANLAPAKIRGEESRGMLLAASNDDALCLVVPEQPMASGSRVK